MANNTKETKRTTQIYVNCTALKEVSNSIAGLQEIAIEIKDCMVQSVGIAAEAEKNTVDLIKTICGESFPALINSTVKLLNAIAADFNRMDKSFSFRPDRKEA